MYFKRCHGNYECHVNNYAPNDFFTTYAGVKLGSLYQEVITNRFKLC